VALYRGVLNRIFTQKAAIGALAAKKPQSKGMGMLHIRQNAGIIGDVCRQ